MPNFTFRCLCLVKLEGRSTSVTATRTARALNEALCISSDVSQSPDVYKAILKLFDGSSEQIKSAAAFAAGEYLSSSGCAAEQI